MNPTANLNILSDNRQDFYDLATECEKAQRNGCDHMCRQCAFNIELYANDLKQAGMIKTIAALDVRKEEDYETQKMWTSIGFLIIAAVAAIIVYSCVH
jgi:hypothetical protein